MCLTMVICFILTFIFFYVERVFSKYRLYISFLLLLLFLVPVLPPSLLVIVIVVCRKVKKILKRDVST